jgi:hypothetical protein
VYHGSIKGAANPSCGSSASPETEEGAAGTDSPGMGGGGIGASTIASVDAAGANGGASNSSPELG